MANLMSMKQTNAVQRHLAAIGGLCYNWAHLDNVIVLTIQTLSGCDDKTLACLLSTSRDTSQRCEIANKLLILNLEDGPWRDCAINTFKLIQNKFCDKRNRYVHDEWQFYEDDIIRTTRTVKIIKAEPLSPQTLSYHANTPTRTKEIEDFVMDMVRATFGMAVISGQFQNQRHELKTLKPPEALLTLYKEYFPEQPPKKNPKQKAPPKSLPGKSQ